MRRGNVFLGSRAVALVLTWAVPAGPAQAASGSPAPAVAAAFNAAATQIPDPVTAAVRGMITGQVLSDVTGLPLPGATVQVVGAAGQPALTDERGRYAIPTADTSVNLVIQKAGHTSAYRAVSVIEGAGTVPADARLTPLSSAVTVDADGTAVSTLSVRSSVAPDGARVAMTIPGSTAGASVSITGLSAQGIPALLPLGWSVLAAFDLRSTAPLSSVSTQLSGLGVNGAAQLVTWDSALNAWRQGGTHAISGGELSLQVSGPGVHALVVADPVDPPIVVPEAGGVLEGLDPVAFPQTATGMGSVDPGTVPPSGATAHGQVSIQGTGLPPSGTPVYTEVTESYDLASNVKAGEEKRGQDILVYRQPPPPAQAAGAPAALHASVPLTPSPSFPTEQLESGNVHLDVYSGREGIRGKVGGSQAITLESGGAQLVLAAGSLPEDAAIVLEAFDGFSSFVASSAGVVPVQELLLDFGGRTLLIPAQLSVDATGLPTDSTYVVARVMRVDGIPRLTVVATASIVGDRLVTQSHPDLPGIRKGGVHVVYRLAAPIGLVAGHVTKAGLPALGVVSTVALPFVGITDPENAGAYVAVAAPGQIMVRASAGGATATATADVAVGATTALDLALAYDTQTATVTPPDGAVGVDRTAFVQVTTNSAAVSGASISGTHFRIRKLGADGAPVADVPVRFVQSAAGTRLSVIPIQQLEELQRYRFEATDVVDVNGAPIGVPVTAFTTKKDEPLAKNVDALTFSFPDASGFVHVTLPPASLPPGTQVLVVNSTNGDVLSMTVDNEGGLTGGRMRGTLDDRLIISITPPDGSIIRFERSQFYDQASGLTAIGPGGGKVTGAGDVEIRVPDGAADHGVKLKIAGVGLEGLPKPPGGGAPLLPLAGPTGVELNFGSALKIETPNKDGFKSEVDLAFPIPEGVPADPTKAFYYVFRRVEGANGKVFHQAVDHAFVEGSGADRRVVTASPPFNGYSANIGRVEMLAGMLNIEAAYHSYAFLMWTYDELMPGKALPGAITGRVLRTQWEPGSAEPTYKPVEGALVTGVDASGVPLLYSTAANTDGARTGPDGTFTFWDARYSGGDVTIVAMAPDVELPQGQPNCEEDPAPTPNFACAEIAESVVRDDESPGLHFYRAVASGTVILPASMPPEPPAGLDIEVYELVDDEMVPGATKRVMGGEVVQAATPLQIGVDFAGETEGLPELRVDGELKDLAADTYAGEFTANYVTSEIELTELGPTTIEVRLPRAIGGTAVFTKQLYVVRGGSLVLPPVLGEPPRVTEWRPREGEKEVAPSAAIEVTFSEPVLNVPQNVRIVALDALDLPDGDPRIFTNAELSGIGRRLNAQLQPIDDRLSYLPSLGVNDLVSMLIVRPRGGLEYGRKYKLILNDGIGPNSTSGIKDRDHDAQGDPAPRSLETSHVTFSTVGDGSIGHQGNTRSPGLAVIGDRAYLVENKFHSGEVHVFDVSTPSAVVPVVQPTAVVVPRPVDVVGAEAHPLANRLLAVGVASTNVSRPSSVYLFDVSDDEETKWIGASTLLTSGVEGFIQRMQIHGTRLYTATMNRGVQIVDLDKARKAYDDYMEKSPQLSLLEKQILLRADLNTDGRGAFQSALLDTIPVKKRSTDGNRVLDIAVGDLPWQGVVQPVAFTTGDNALSIVVPQVGKAVFAGALETPIYKIENNPQEGEPAGRDEGRAIALARVRLPASIPCSVSCTDRPVAIVAGRGRAKQETGVGPFEPAPVLLVVDLLEALQTQFSDGPPALPDFLGAPVVLGGIKLSTDPAATIEDLEVFGTFVVVGMSDGTAEVVSFADPLKPVSAGVRQGVGGRLALGRDGVLFSTANGVMGQGDPLPGQGVNATRLSRQPLIVLKTPRVIDPFILDEKHEVASDGDSGPLFVVNRTARIKFRQKGNLSPILSRLDEAAESKVWNGDDDYDVVESGRPHRLWIEDQDILAKKVGEEIGFEIIAQDVDEPQRIETVSGTLQRDRRDRDVLPVGTTFVKNVSVSNGQMVLSRTDFELPGRNFQLKMTRTYSSSGNRWEGLLGANWDWPFEGRIEKIAREDKTFYVVRTITGTTQEFEQRGACDFVPPRGYHTELKCDPDPPVEGQVSNLVFTDFQKTEHTFQRLPKVLKTSMDTWWIRQMKELHGDTLEIRYDDFGRVTRVNEGRGETVLHNLRFEYTQAGGDDRVAAAFFDQGHIVVRYRYDEDGNLVQVTREGRNENDDRDTDDRIEKYEYSEEKHAAHKMTAFTDASQVRTEYEWETPSQTPWWNDPRLSRIKEVDTEGQTAVTAFDRSRGKVVVVDGPRDNDNTTYTLNDYGNVTRIEEPAGRTTVIEWDELTQRKKSETDAKNRRTSFDYDPDSGSLIKETIHTVGDALLGDVKTEFRYHGTNVLEWKKDALDHVTEWGVLDNGDIGWMKDAAGNQTTYQRDTTTGILLGQLGPEAGVQTFTYAEHNDWGQPELVTDAGLKQTHRSYDGRGRLWQETNDRTGLTTTYTYDAMDRVTRVVQEDVSAGTQAPPLVTETTYYGEGQPRTVRVAPGQANELLTENVLDQRGRVKQTVKTTAPTQVPGGAPTVPVPLSWEYGYDLSGNLVREVDPRQVELTHHYDELNRRTKTVLTGGPPQKPDVGTVIAEASYDTLVKQWEADISRNVTHYGYDGLYRVNQRQISKGEGGQKALLDADTYDKVGNHKSHRDSCSPSHETRWEHDELGRVTQTINAKGQTVITKYEDQPGNEAGSHVYKSEDWDPTRKLRTTYQHDDLGRETDRIVTLEVPGDVVQYKWHTDYDKPGPNDTVVTLTDESHPGQPKVTQTERDGLGRVLAVTVAPEMEGSRPSRFFYDHIGNKRAETDPGDHETVYYADGLGRVHAVEDADGYVATVAYEGEKLVAETVNREAAKTLFTYDKLGRQTSTRVLSREGTLVTQSQVTYDDAGRKRTERNGRDKETVFVLDERGRVREEISPLPAAEHGIPSRKFHYEGDELRWQEDRRGKRTVFDYDELHRLTETTQPALPNLSANDAARNVKVEYRDSENVRIDIDRRGTQTITQLDPLGRTRLVTRDGKVQERTKYDAEGNVLEKVDGRDVKTVNGYDAAWRLTSVTVAPDSPGRMRTTYGLNADGLREWEWEGGGEPKELVAHTQYYDTHRVKLVRDGFGGETTYAYDKEGNRNLVVEPATEATASRAASPAHETRFAYDALNRLVKVEDGSGKEQVTEYVRDGNGNVESIYEHPEVGGPQRLRVKIKYDELDREIERTQLGTSSGDLLTQRGYDADDNLTTLTDASGNLTTTQYDALNRPERIDFQPAGGQEAAWRSVCRVVFTERDGNGNPRQITEQTADGNGACSPSRTITRAYDALDRLTSESALLPGGTSQTIGFAYYDNGLRSTVHHPGGGRTDYVYDAANRLQSIQNSDWGQQQATLGYDRPDGRLRTVRYPNGVTTEYDYDLANRISSIETLLGEQPISRYSYEYYLNGDRQLQRETNGNGEELTSYTYDPLRRLKRVDYPGGKAAGYDYDGVGNRWREKQYLNDVEMGVRQASFDSANRLLNLTGPAGPTTFSWNKNGSMSSRTDPSGTTNFVYDAQAQLAEVRHGQSIVGRYQYDFLGRRIKTIGSDGIREYVYDDTSIGAEFSDTGVLIARNVWSDDSLLSVKRPTLGGESFYHQDALGSVVSVTGGAGAVFSRNRLDAWGNFRVPEDEDPTNPIAAANRFAFTGHIYDRETDLYYAKARYYDPELGRFLTQDSFLGNYDDAPSLHRYAYGHNRPTYYVDPDGHAVTEVAARTAELAAEEAKRRLAREAAAQAARRTFTVVAQQGARTAATEVAVATGGETLAASAGGMAVPLIGWGIAAITVTKFATGSYEEYELGKLRAVEGEVIEANEAAWLKQEQQALLVPVIAQPGETPDQARRRAALIAQGVPFVYSTGDDSGRAPNAGGNGEGPRDARSTAAGRVKAPPNPWGQAGKADHRATVARLRQQAQSEFPDDIIHEGTSIKPLTGVNRRPDVWVEDATTGEVRKVYEAARLERSGEFVRRERLKREQYIEAGIPHHFEPVKP